MTPGRVALVVGGASSRGRTVALRLAAAGIDLVVADLDAEGARVVARAAAVLGVRAQPVSMDVSDEDSVDATVDLAVSALGRLDVLVDVVDVAIASPEGAATGAGPWAACERAVAVNVRGPLLCLRAAARVMREVEGGGSVIRVADAATSPDATFVAAARGLRASGVRAHVVLGGDDAAIAEIVHFLASDPARGVGGAVVRLADLG